VLKAQKIVKVDEMATALKGSELVVIANHNALTVAEISNLRRRLKKADAGLRVTKNRLAKRSLNGTKFVGLTDYFSGATLIAYSADPVAAAKELVEFAKGNDKIKIIAGGFGEKVIDAAAVNALAKLPGINELRAQLLGLFNEPARRVASVLQAPVGQLARVVQARVDQQQSS
jgi:large subunit ribosomal protein L10